VADTHESETASSNTSRCIREAVVLLFYAAAFLFIIPPVQSSPETTVHFGGGLKLAIPLFLSATVLDLEHTKPRLLLIAFMALRGVGFFLLAVAIFRRVVVGVN
jgi:hypothetical protein